MSRYFLRFRHSDTGLTPSFLTFKKASDLTVVAPPPIAEITTPFNGSYYFDYSPTFDIVFEVDGGASIPTEEVRFISDTISPRDSYVDEPSSQIKNDVWNDVVDRTVGTKGDYVEMLAGFGTLNTNINTANVSLADIKGTGFTTGNDSLHKISQKIDNISTVQQPQGIADAVWNEPLANHASGDTMGQAQQLENSGSPTIATSTNITLDATTAAAAIAANDDYYKNGVILITSGQGAGQARSITAYGGVSQIATVDRVWAVGSVPNSDSKYIIIAAAPSSGGGGGPSAATIAAAVWDEVTTAHVIDGSFGQTLQLLNFGTAQAGAAGSLTLAVSASAILNFYNNALLVITSGTGVGQARTITAYTTGRVASVDRNWGTPPNATSKYMVIPAAQAPLDTATIADSVWDEALSGHLSVGSTGAKLNSGSGGGGVSFLSNGDTVNPIIVQVSSPKHTQVKITYSEPVVMTTGANGALNLLNYTIPGLTLIAVSSLTSQQVLLTTSAQTPDFLYSLSIINVEDLVGNPIL